MGIFLPTSSVTIKHLSNKLHFLHLQHSSCKYSVLAPEPTISRAFRASHLFAVSVADFNAMEKVEGNEQVVGSFEQNAEESESVRMILTYIIMEQLQDLDDHALYCPGFDKPREADDQADERYRVLGDVMEHLHDLCRTNPRSFLRPEWFDDEHRRNLKAAVDRGKIREAPVNALVIRNWTDMRRARQEGRVFPQWYEKRQVPRKTTSVHLPGDEGFPIPNPTARLSSTPVTEDDEQRHTVSASGYSVLFGYS